MTARDPSFEEDSYDPQVIFMFKRKTCKGEENDHTG